MATNEIFKPGYQQSLVVNSPASPVSNDPIRVGKLTGYALTDKGAGGNDPTKTSVDVGPFVATFVVDDDIGGGIAVGDPIYFHDAGTGTGAVHLNNNATAADAFFGIAEEVVGANATTAIRVFHFPVGLTGTMSGSVGAGQIAADAVGGAALGNLAEGDLQFGPAALLVFDIPDGATGNVDFVNTEKFAVVDSHVIVQGASGANANTIQVDNGTGGLHITDAISTNGKVLGDVVRAASLLNRVIAAGATIRVIRTRAGGVNAAKVVLFGYPTA
jgi:hypothetical protein